MKSHEFNKLYESQKRADELVELPDDFESQVDEIEDDTTLEYRREELARTRTNLMVRAMMNGGIDEKKLTDAERDAADRLREGVTQTLDAQLGRQNETEEDAQEAGERPLEAENESDRLEVRLLEDVPDILGTDMHEYTNLGEEDVVSLPKKNAEALVDKDAAKPAMGNDAEDRGDAALADEETESEGSEDDMLAQAMGADD